MRFHWEWRGWRVLDLLKSEAIPNTSLPLRTAFDIKSCRWHSVFRQTGHIEIFHAVSTAVLTPLSLSVSSGFYSGFYRP